MAPRQKPPPPPLLFWTSSLFLTTPPPLQSTAHTVILVILLLLPLFLPTLSRLLQLVLLFLGDAPTVLSTTISLSCFLPLLDPTTPQIPLLVLHLAIETTTIATMTTPASASSLLPVRPPPSSSLLLLWLPLLIPFLLTPIILFLPLSYHGSFYCYCYCSHSLLQNFPSLIIRNLEPILTNNSKKLVTKFGGRVNSHKHLNCRLIIQCNFKQKIGSACQFFNINKAPRRDNRD